jgi:hypothetical protein
MLTATHTYAYRFLAINFINLIFYKTAQTGLQVSHYPQSLTLLLPMLSSLRGRHCCLVHVKRPLTRVAGYHSIMQ